MYILIDISAKLLQLMGWEMVLRDMGVVRNCGKTFLAFIKINRQGKEVGLLSCDVLISNF